MGGFFCSTIFKHQFTCTFKPKIRIEAWKTFATSTVMMVLGF
jgi:hypothetical protein